jgi:uncharacterized protein YacL
LLPAERAERQRLELLKLLRAGFFIVFVTVTALAVLATGLEGDRVQVGPLALRSTWQVTLLVAALFGVLAVAADLLMPTKKISTLTGIFFGLLTAMLLTAAFGYVIDLLVKLYEIRTAEGDAPDFVHTSKVLVGVGLAYVCIATVLQTQDDFRLVIPYVEFAKQLRGPRPILLDSSTLIDARIVDLAATGVFQAPLVVPRFIVLELQTLADRGDAIKRERGRRGLEIVGALQDNPLLDVSIDETPVQAQSVDQMLVELARRMGAVIATTDTGLSAVARINDVRVLSVHDLARACKPVTFAGESFRIKLVRPGEQPGQGVGYLDDGTMVVVNEGAALVGRTVAVSAKSTIPTAAGRLVFADLAETEVQHEDRLAVGVARLANADPAAQPGPRPSTVDEDQPEAMTQDPAASAGVLRPRPLLGPRGRTPRNPRR